MGTTAGDRRAPTKRALISSTEESRGTEFQIWAELVDCDYPPDSVELRFVSTWTGARLPEEAQIRGKFMLDATGLDDLRRLLGAR